MLGDLFIIPVALRVWLPDRPVGASPGKLLEMQNLGSNLPYEKLWQRSGRAGGVSAICVLTSPTGDSDTWSSLRPTALPYTTSFTAREYHLQWFAFHKQPQPGSCVPPSLQKVLSWCVRIQEISKYAKLDEVFKQATQPPIN